MRVLVVAKERFVALALRDELEDAGHLVIGPASSSGEALLLCNTAEPQCAVVDVHLELPGIGAHLARRLCERASYVVLTSDSTDDLDACPGSVLHVISRTHDAKSIVRMLPASAQPGQSNRSARTEVTTFKD